MAAWLSATAPTIAGPRVNPKSRSMLVDPLAMPARWLGTVFTATVVNDDTASAKPDPTRMSGTMTGASDRFVAGTAASHSAPAPISMHPAPSGHFGLNRSISREVRVTWITAMPFRNKNAMEVFSGVNPWMTDSRMLVAYAVPRKANMPSTVTIAATANARLANRPSRSSGAADRRSTRTNSAREIAATMNPATT